MTSFFTRLLPLILIFIPLLNYASQPRAYFSYGEFFAPGKGPYVETYLSIIGNTLSAKKIKDKKVAEVEITIIFKQGEKIANFSKFNITSPEVADTLSLPNFIDQQRFVLPNGNYTLEILLKDLNNPENQLLHSEDIQVDLSGEQTSFSSIQFIESYAPTTKNNILSKSGYDLIPYIANFFPASMEKLTFYSELYNTETKLGKDEKFLITYYLENADSKTRLDQFSSFSRKSTAPVVIVFGEFPLETLPSGNYNLVVEARNKNNELVTSRSTFFQRSLPSPLATVSLSDLPVESTFAGAFTMDTLNELLKTLYPIASSSERTFINNQMKSPDLVLKQQFFLKFWSTRNSNDPEKAWNDYKVRLRQADEAYSAGPKRGYQTDRGITFLKYGLPNTIDSRPSEPNSYPYEVWHYYKIGNFSNRRFIFYNPKIASSDYELLHSDMYGEANNPRWQYVLQQRVTPNNDIYNDSGREGFGTDTDNPFLTPRR